MRREQLHIPPQRSVSRLLLSSLLISGSLVGGSLGGPFYFGLAGAQRIAPARATPETTPTTPIAPTSAPPPSVLAALLAPATLTLPMAPVLPRPPQTLQTSPPSQAQAPNPNRSVPSQETQAVQSTATPAPTTPDKPATEPAQSTKPAQPDKPAQPAQPSSTATSTGNVQNVCQLPSGALPRLNRTVFVLDTSGSMQGKGDGKADIFEKVKKSIRNYVKSADPDVIELIAFDSGVRQTKSYAWPSDAKRFEQELADLKADGNNTYLYRSLQSVLTPLTSPDQYVTNVFVLTDGIDNDPDKRNTAKAALDAFQQRGALDTLSYIALGTEIPEAARQAILESSYASGLTMPVGQVPKLLDIGIATQLMQTADPNNVLVPFPDGTGLILNSTNTNVTLTQPEVSEHAVRLSAPVDMKIGTPALLCAPPDPRNNVVGPRLRRVLMTLNFAGESGGLLLLNPHDRRVLRSGGDLRLIYRADPSLNLGKGSLKVTLPPREGGGVDATVHRVGDAREFVVHYRARNSLVGAQVRPMLSLSSGRSISLDSITLRGDGRVATNPTSLEGEAKNPSSWLAILTSGALLLLGSLIYFPIILWDRRREYAGNIGRAWQGGVSRLGKQKAAMSRKRSGASSAAATTSAGAHAAQAAQADSAAAAAQRLGKITTRPPSLQGLEYDANRKLLLLDQADGRTLIPTPHTGPFDVGLLSRVPHLRDLRVDQRPEGLRLLHVPNDLHVHDDLRRLREGDIVPAGTIVGIQIINPHRASYAALGKLVGLGLPLMLDTHGGGLRLSGPYADHMVALHPGINDLGDLVGAPALLGLKLSSSGPRILLAGVPAGMVLTDVASTQTLHPGAYLPNQTHIRLPEQWPQPSQAQLGEPSGEDS